MASINYAAREISVKIVYYGPGLSGKTTNLLVIHKKVPKEFKSDMVSLATETDRTLFFDFLPLDLGKIKGFSAKFQLYTVPGQVYYNATRKLVLRGVDGIVFVADSATDKMQENLESFKNMVENLAEYGYKLENICIVMQYNKRDLPSVLPVEELNKALNKYNFPWTEAVANKGKGVFETLKLIGKYVIDALNKKYSRQQRPSGPRTPVPPQTLSSSQPMPPPQTLQPRRDTREFYPPPPPPPPRQQEKPKPPNPFLDNFGSFGQSAPQQKSVEPKTPPPGSGRNEYTDQNTINLEPMTANPFGGNAPQQPKPFSPPTMQAAKSGLDMGIEQFEREIKKGQGQDRGSYSGNPSFSSPGQYQPGKYNPGQTSTQFEQTFSPPVRNAPGYSSNPAASQPQFQAPGTMAGIQTQYGQQSHNQDFGSYNLQQKSSSATAASPGLEQKNNPMFFTSVNTDKSKKKIKKPLNPKNKPKGLFGKFFNKEPE